MTQRKVRADDRQLDLLELIEQLDRVSPETPVAGSLDLDAQLRLALSEALRCAPGSRFEVAARMSELMGVEVTKWQLDSWTAESKEGHRFPAAYLPAFCAAAGSWDVLALLARACGRRVHADPRVDVEARIGRMRAEIQVEERRLRERKRQLRDAVEALTGSTVGGKR